jgi:hypothetical protein
MIRRNEERKGSSSVTFRVPDFVGEDGIEYTDIQVVAEMGGGIRYTADIADTLECPLKTKGGAGR